MRSSSGIYSHTAPPDQFYTHLLDATISISVLYICYRIKKGLDFSVETVLSSAISFRLPSASISAAASFRLTLVFHFRFRPSLGRPFHGLSPLPFRFLTSAVSAFFRPPQFWILTTQPLFFRSFSSRFRLTAAFPMPVSALASSVSPFSPT